jgi:hypothetical protein
MDGYGLTLKRIFHLIALAGTLWALVAPASARAVECADGVRKSDVRIQLWKEPHCQGAWIEVPFGGDGDRPDFRRFRHSDGDLYDVDDNRESAVVAVGHCVRFFTDPGYGGQATRLRCARRDDRSINMPEGVSSMRACPRVAITLCRRNAVAGSREALSSSGSIEEVHFDRPGSYPAACTGAALPAVIRLAKLIEERWRSGSVRLGHSCVQKRPGVVDVHGEGRALDWALDAGSPNDLAIGDAIVAWVLADDRNGHRYARARRMGVQEVAWNGRIWTSSRWKEGLRTIQHGDRRRNWIHIAFTWAGARVQTSYWK